MQWEVKLLILKMGNYELGNIRKDGIEIQE